MTTPAVILGRLILACLFNGYAIVILVAWFMGFNVASLKGAVIAALLGWVLMPPRDDVELIIKLMNKATKP